ncbi:hypothetical protein DOY81_013627, partial [Sarcophaga bullata]
KESCAEANTFDLDPTVLHETAEIPDLLVNIKDVTVWIDPLDATQEFTEQLYEYVTTMVCVAVEGKPVIGVIHSPFIGQTAWAWVDHSMSEYLSSIHPDTPNIEHPIITLINATAYLHSTKIKKWDICAGDAILRALGGTMTTLDDELIDYGPDESPVNARGLLATIVKHDEYIDKLMAYRNTHNMSKNHR